MLRNRSKLNSLMLILNQLHRHNRVIASSLADQLGVSDRTVYRYILTLQDAGYPIYFDRNEISYRFVEGYSLKSNPESEFYAPLDLQGRMFGATSVGLLSYSVSGKCEEANEAAALIIGTSREELLLQNYLTLESWKTSGLLLMAQEVISKGNECCNEFNMLTAFGKSIWIRCLMSLFNLNEKEFLLLAVQDISDYKKMELSLKESEERFKLILENAPIGMTVVALDGRFLLVNESLCKIVGYEKAELEKLTFQEITYPDDLAIDLDYVNQMLEGKIKIYSMNKRYIRKDNTIIWIKLSVSLVRNSLDEPQYFISQIQQI